MKSISKKSIRIVLVSVAIVAIVGVGTSYIYISNRHSVQPDSMSATDTTKGWETFTLKYEKLSFLYPPSWRIIDSTNDTTELDGLVVIGPSAFEINIEAGRPITAQATGPVRVLGADKLIFLGEDAYMVYSALPTANTTVGLVYLNASSADTAPIYTSKHTMPRAAAQGANGNIGITMGYIADSAGGVSTQQNLDQARQDPNFSIAKTIIESMHY